MRPSYLNLELCEEYIRLRHGLESSRTAGVAIGKQQSKHTHFGEQQLKPSQSGSSS